MLHRPLVQACLNGRRSRDEHPALPVAPEDLARDARACVAAGAGSLHAHPRDGRGEQTLDAAAVADALAALREAAPGVEISLTTGLWIEGDPVRRLARVAAWTSQPDLASVNLSEPGAADLARLLLDRGIGVEAGIATADDARALAASGLAPRCRRLLLEIDGSAPAALGLVTWIDRVLDQAAVMAPRLYHGYDTATWAVIDRAFLAGRDARVGLEDTLVLPDGRPAPDNATLVSMAVAGAGLGRP